MAPNVSKLASASSSSSVPAVQKDKMIEDKVAKRFAQIIERHRKHPDPVRIQCDAILAHPRNRNGHAPNIQYIHRTLIPNIISQGFDPKRPNHGYLVELTNEKQKERVLNFNRAFGSHKSGVLPPIFDENVKYACLGGNHLTISLRMLKHQVHSSITGQRMVAPDSDVELQQVINLGHTYIVLDGDSLSDSDAELVSRWLNSDQDQNQASGTAMVMRSLTDLIRLEKKQCAQVRISTVIAKFSTQSCLKIPSNTLGYLTRWIIELGAEGYVDELLDFHSECVNPNTMMVAPLWFEDLTKVYGLPSYVIAVCDVMSSRQQHVEGRSQCQCM